MVHDRSNHIRPIESVAASAEVVLKVVVELERLAALQSYRAIHSPAVPELLHAPVHVWQVVSENPGKTMGYVEVRRPIFQIRPRTVVGLRRVGLEIFSVARIIQGLRPYIVHKRRDTVPSVDPEARLQRVVVGLSRGVLLQHVICAVGVTRKWTRSITKVGDALASRVGSVNRRSAGLVDIKEAPQ